MSDRWYAVENYPDTITAFSNTGYARDIESTSKKRYISVRAPDAVQRARDIGTRDGIAVTADLVADASSSVGTTTPVSLERARERNRLISLIGQLARDCYSCVRERPSAVSEDSANAARALFEILLPAHQVPKIAPDGEGGLLAIWESREHPIVLVIDNWRLHLVVDAATPKARYFDNLPFDGERIPDAIIESIPS
jgi:hypothetical protein